MYTYTPTFKSSPLNANETLILDFIENKIRMGFSSTDYLKEDVIDLIEDNGLEDDISRDWAFEQVNTAYKKLVEEQKLWDKPTDTERLVRAFDDLCDLNIIAIHKAGYTTSDGRSEVIEIEAALRKKKISADGYCFYHEQDLKRAMGNQNPSLYLTFQKLNNADDAVTIGIGNTIVTILEKHGFNVDWNGTATSRILISPFKWQLVYQPTNRDLLDYDQVVKRMLPKE